MTKKEPAGLDPGGQYTVTSPKPIVPSGDRPPHSDDAEADVLTGLMNGAPMPEGLVADHFYVGANAELYKICTDLVGRGLRPAEPQIRNVLEESGRLKAIGGHARLTELEFSSAAADLQPIADRIIGLFRQRESIRLGRELAMSYDIDKVTAELQRLNDSCPIRSVNDWPERQPIPESADPVPGLPVELLPKALRPWLVDLAERDVLPLELFAVPALIALGSVVGRSFAIRPELRNNWTVVPNLWGGIIARPGLLKTHAIESGLAPLSPLIKAAEEKHIKEARTVSARRMVLDDRLKAARHRKGGATEGEIASLLAEIEECRAVERRLKTHDATVEKLGELLRDNSRGLLVVRDELAGWLRGFDRQGREGEREFFLEAWNGTGSYVFDRIGRGTIKIPALCLSVVGGIQPGKLAAYVAGAVNGGQGADGLLQRLQVVVWPDRYEKWTEPSRWPDHEAEVRAFQIFASLYELDPAAVGAMTDNEIPFLKFAPGAQELFTAWRNKLERRVRGDELLAFPAFESHLSKYRSLMPSLALLFHLVEVVAGSTEPQAGVSLHTAGLAAAWCEFLELHARKIYSVELEPERAAARAIAARIKAGAVEHGSTVRDVYRSQWADLKTPEVVGTGLELLERLGWLRVVPEDRSGPGRRSNLLELHPDLRKSGS